MALPAYAGSLDFQYARPVGGTSGGVKR
jgi:hypothetical protein